MPKAASTLTWSAASRTYQWSVEPGGEVLSLIPDSTAWFAWLTELPSFAFHGQEGSCTARLEAVQRGERYWYAYRRTGQKLRKKYLGKTADLTLARLEQVARLLKAEQARDEPPDNAPVEPLAPQESPPRALIPPAQQTTAGPDIVVEGPPEVQVALPSDPLTPLLATRLHVPRSPARLVPRARLRQRLEQSLILVCAPAGFGKTTLLAACWPLGCPWTRRTTTRYASSGRCWQPSRPVIPLLGPACVRSSRPGTACQACPCPPSSRYCWASWPAVTAMSCCSCWTTITTSGVTPLSTPWPF